MSDYDEFDPDHVDCCIVPEFVEEQDGYYTQRVVLDAPFDAGPLPETATAPTGAPRFRVERLEQPIPRYRKRLRWRRV